MASSRNFPNHVFEYVVPTMKENVALFKIEKQLLDRKVMFAYYTYKPSDNQWYFQAYEDKFLIYVRNAKDHVTTLIKDNVSLLQIKSFCVNAMRTGLSIATCAPFCLSDDDDGSSTNDKFSPGAPLLTLESPTGCTLYQAKCQEKSLGFAIPGGIIISHREYQSLLQVGKVDTFYRGRRVRMGLLKAKATMYSDCEIHCSFCTRVSISKTNCGHSICDICYDKFITSKRSICPVCYTPRFLTGETQFE